MAFLRTTLLIERLSQRLQSLPLAEQPKPGDNERMFERVGLFGANKLAEAMSATFASEQRVAFIVPVGDAHTDTRDRNVLLSSRTTSLVVLMADRALDRAKAEALAGGVNNIGILMMKDRVIENLFAVPFTDPADLAFAPGTGEPLVISKPEAGNLGRECWAQTLTAYAGMSRTAIP